MFWEVVIAALRRVEAGIMKIVSSVRYAKVLSQEVGGGLGSDSGIRGKYRLEAQKTEVSYVLVSMAGSDNRTKGVLYARPRPRSCGE